MAFPRSILSVIMIGALVAPHGAAAAAGGSFADDDGTPYEHAIEKLAAKDIVAGCDDDSRRFCPRAPVRRDQAASLLVRAFDLPPTDRDHFDDDDASVHEDAINRLASAGISLGCARADAYCVDETLRRDQIAALLVRTSKLKATDKTYFRDAGSGKRNAVNRLAAAGITAGCTTAPTRFCPGNDVLRGELALFLARTLELRPRATLRPLPKAKAAKAEVKRKTASAKRAKARPSTNTVWDRLAHCESAGNWSSNTGNGYYGGLQFSLASWRAVGGSGSPHQHSREEQIKRGKRLKASSGWGAWPACARKLGLR
jgi:hypothetical protein